MNALIGVVLIAVFASLGSALYYMVTPGGRGSDAMVKSLSFRIGLSVVLFIMLMVLWMAGVIEPHGIAR